MVQLHIFFTSWSHKNDLQLPMLFIAHTAVVLSDNTFIWVCLKWLHKLLSLNKTAFSSKTLMCKSYSSSAKCPPQVSLSKIASQPDLDASVFDKRLQFGICIELNESSIFFIHHKMCIFPACETFTFLSNFLWQIWAREFYSFPMTCNAMCQNTLQENCS